MGTQLRTPPEAPRTSENYRIEGINGGPHLGPYYADRCWSLRTTHVLYCIKKELKPRFL